MAVNSLENKSYLENFIDYVDSFSKNDIDQALSNFLSASLYYSIASPIARPYIGGSTFDYHVTEAIGFKLFASAVTPAILQAISTYSEIPLKKADYAFQSLRCWMPFEKEDHCDTLQNDPTSIGTPHDHSWSDFSWFNKTAYTESVNDNFGKLTVENLMTTGLFSAISTEIMTEVYRQFDFTAPSETFLFKHLINSYFKDWIKTELNNTLTDLTDLTTTLTEKDLFESSSPPLFDSTYHSGPLNGTIKESLVDQSFEPICRVRENELPPTPHEV